MLAGWSSNNKFSLMGGLRSSAQIISYELAMTTAAAGVILAAGSFRLTDIVAMQERQLARLHSRAGTSCRSSSGSSIFFIAAFAETNRLPFDLPEAEAELVAGYHTEYSAMKFAMFFMAEYVNVIVASRADGDALLRRLVAAGVSSARASSAAILSRSWSSRSRPASSSASSSGSAGRSRASATTSSCASAGRSSCRSRSSTSSGSRRS